MSVYIDDDGNAISRSEALPLVEELARAMCGTSGRDPDMIEINDGPLWRYYVPQAEAILPIIERACREAIEQDRRTFSPTELDQARVEGAAAERERVVAFVREIAEAQRPYHAGEILDTLADHIEANLYLPATVIKP